MLKIYNSYTKQKEEFKPLQPGKVGLYVCGITVYDYCHIGHARMSANFDMVSRYFRYRDYDVTYVKNITDIDDKIINRANENNEPVEALTARFIEAMHEDEARLNVKLPDIEPRATDYIKQIIQMVQTLVDKEYAYVADNGDVYYNVSKFEDYGKLAHKNLDDLQAGARIAITDVKHNPLDFVLWKMAKPDEPSWDSPWGKGRPGWHIECSAMSTACLGNNFDIHGGGFDLKFPHHENELAQSEAATGEKFVNLWMHVGFVQVNKEKMSKSLGNFFTIREVLDKYKPEVVRYLLVSSHYRSPINFSQESLDIAKGALERFYTTLRGLPASEPTTDTEFEQQFIAAMDDDFNAPEALAVLFNITHEINKLRADNIAKAAALGALLRKLGLVLGVLQLDAEDYLQAGDELGTEQVARIEALIAERKQVRIDKNWARADEIRQELTDMGIVLEDGADGTSWRVE